MVSINSYQITISSVPFVFFYCWMYYFHYLNGIGRKNLHRNGQTKLHEKKKKNLDGKYTISTNWEKPTISPKMDFFWGRFAPFCHDVAFISLLNKTMATTTSTQCGTLVWLATYLSMNVYYSGVHFGAYFYQLCCL